VKQPRKIDSFGKYLLRIHVSLIIVEVVAITMMATAGFFFSKSYAVVARNQ
jgi:hypothetical protein